MLGNADESETGEDSTPNCDSLNTNVLDTSTLDSSATDLDPNENSLKDGVNKESEHAEFERLKRQVELELLALTSHSSVPEEFKAVIREHEGALFGSRSDDLVGQTS